MKRILSFVVLLAGCYAGVGTPTLPAHTDIAGSGGIKRGDIISQGGIARVVHGPEMSGNGTIATPLKFRQDCSITNTIIWSGTSWDCGTSSAADAISGTLTSPKVPRASGLHTLVDSSISDNGSAVTVAEYATFSGSTGQDSLISNLAFTGQTATSRAIKAFNSGTYDTTSGQLIAYGVYSLAHGTRSAGSNQLWNIAIYGDATGGQSNYAAYFDSGDVLANASNGSTFVALTSSGKLGVGTATPGGNGVITYGDSADIKEHMFVTSGHDILLIDNTATNGDSGIQIYTKINNEDAAIFLDESDARKLKFCTTGSSTGISSHTDRQNCTHMTMDQSGNVGIGTTSPGVPLEVNGAAKISGALDMNTHLINNVTDPSSAQDAATKHFIVTSSASQFTSTTQGTVPSSGGGTTNYLRADGTWTAPPGSSAMTIGGSVSGGTTGSVLFIGSGPVLAQDNSKFFWDDTNFRLGIGTASPAFALDINSIFQADTSGKTWFVTQSAADPANGTGAITLKNTNTACCTQITTRDNGGTLRWALGTDNSVANGGAYIYVNSSTSYGLLVTGPSPGAQIFSGVSGGAGMQLWDGNSLSASASSTARLRYVNSSTKFQASFSGGSYLDVGMYAASLTSGSVLFADGSNHIAQSNADFFWDNTNKRLGFDTTSPSYPVDIRNASTATRVHIASTTSDDGMYLIAAQASQAVLCGGMSYDGAGNFKAKATTALCMDTNNANLLIYSATGLTLGNNVSATTKLELYAAGGLELLNSDSATASIASAGKIRYQSSGQKLQASLNTGSYNDIAVWTATSTSNAILKAANANGGTTNSSITDDGTTVSTSEVVSLSNSKNIGSITLSTGTGTATVRSGAKCVCSDTTAANVCVPTVSSTTLTITGTGSDVVNYWCD